MKREVPQAVIQLHGYLLMKQRFEDAAFVSTVITAMEQQKPLSRDDAQRFRDLLTSFRKIQLMRGLFR